MLETIAFVGVSTEHDVRVKFRTLCLVQDPRDEIKFADIATMGVPVD